MSAFLFKLIRGSLPTAHALEPTADGEHVGAYCACAGAASPDENMLIPTAHASNGLHSRIMCNLYECQSPK